MPSCRIVISQKTANLKDWGKSGLQDEEQSSAPILKSRGAALKAKEDLDPLNPHNITFLRGSNNLCSFSSEAVRRGLAIGAGVNFARRLGNWRPDVGVPLAYANECAKLAKSTHGKKRKLRVVEVLNKTQLFEKGLHLMHAVGKGARCEPRLVVLEYIGQPKKDSSIGLVGKGLTMDTGGLHVKTYGFMEEMHQDKMGAMAVLGTLHAICELQAPVNVVGVIALAENAIGADSYLPSTILRSLKGTTVEVRNTDAEGRLVLADAMWYAQSSCKKISRPIRTLVDVATLTGACVIALGEKRAGLFGNDKGLIRELFASGQQTGEPLWPMPIGPEHRDLMKGTLSDLLNAAPGRYGGACTAAAFLEHFVAPGVKWAHLDIAGPGIGTKATSTHNAGTTGFGVKLLTSFLETKKY